MEIKIFLTNLGKYNEGELVGKWVNVESDTDWTKELEEIGVKEGSDYEEYFITDWESDITGLEVGEYESLSHLSNIMEEIECLDESDEAELQAILEAGIASGVLEAIGELGSHVFLQGIDDEYDLGELYAEEAVQALPEEMRDYFDYARYGEYIASNGSFVTGGFIFY